MMRRGLSEESESDIDLSEISQRIVTFFLYWSNNNPDGMLTLCDSGWKACFEDPQAELLLICVEQNLLQSQTGSGSNLTLIDDYKDGNFDDLFE